MSSLREYSPTNEDSQPAGPLCVGLASLYLTIAVFLGSNAAPAPPIAWAAALGLAFGSLFLAPKESLARLIVDGPLLLLLAWMTISLAWSLNIAQGIFEVRRDLTTVAAVSFIASLLTPAQAIKAIQRSLYLILIVTFVAVILIPSTRHHENFSINGEPYPGWHGLFVHKNVMAPYLVFGLCTTLIFEEGRRRVAVLAAILILLAGSQSATGLSAAAVGIAIYYWVGMLRRSPSRLSSAFAFASFTTLTLSLFGAWLSLTAILDAYGKDLTFSSRTEIWAAALDAIADAPILGYGIGSLFWRPANPVTAEIWRNVGFEIPHVHSGTLSVVLRLGLIGLGLYLMLLVSSIRKMRLLWSPLPDYSDWILIVISVQLLMSLSEPVFLANWLVYIAVLRAISQKAYNDHRRQLDQRSLRDSRARRTVNG